MRIIAGAQGGRRIRAPRGRGTRPTPERVREAVFSALGPVDGLTVLDLFAGSGAMGLEALSRGAAEATLVDRDRSAHATIMRNVEQLELGERCRVLRADWRRVIESASGAEIRYDMVFLDPPYEEWEALQAGLGPALVPVLGPAARLIAEHPATEAPRLQYMQTERCRTYGDTAVSFLTPTAGALDT